MATHAERLSLATETYRRWQSRHDGGWGEGRWGRPGYDVPSSIVNTAEVLSVLKAAGVPYDDEMVQRGLGYLAEAVRVHPRPTGRGGRGSRTRYPAFGILGLTLYKESRHDPSLERGQTDCIEWLENHPRDAAWGEQPEAEHPSLTSTHAAVIGLSRICPRHPRGRSAAKLAASARRTTLSLSRKNGSQRSWSKSPAEEDPSSAATALGSLILSSGDKAQRAAASEGARWLYERVDLWSGKVEGDNLIAGANWRHMTFSLGLRAVLAPPTPYSTDAEVLAGPIAYLDTLWDPRGGEWRHGHPTTKSSPTGSCAVALACEAVRRARPLDPTSLNGNSRRRRRRATYKPEVTVRVDLSREGKHPWKVTVIDLHGKEMARQALTWKRGYLFALLAQRRAMAGQEGGRNDRSLSTGEIARQLGWSKMDTVRRNILRINGDLTKAAAENNRGLGELIQMIGEAPTPAQRRWGLDVDHVTVSPRSRREIDEFATGR